MKRQNNQRGIGGIAIFVIIVVIAAIAGGVVYMAGKNQTNTAMQPVTTPEANVTTMTPAPTSVVSGDTTDAGIAKDSANVDTQLKAADQDGTSIDAGLNDQQGNLSEN